MKNSEGEMVMEKEYTTLENLAVERIFAERKDFIIIGLTGRTGCGCSTVAKFLCKSFDDLQPPIPTSINSISEREDKIIYEYTKNTWTSFRLIEMKHVIFTFILENDFHKLEKFITDVLGEKINISGLKKDI